MGPERSDMPIAGDMDHVVANLGALSAKGNMVTLVGQSIVFLITLFGTAILARILLPSDFGLIAMVMTIFGAFFFIKDLGLSGATVQRIDIHDSHISGAFWLNLLFSFTIFVFLWVAAPGVAWIYSEPRLTRITRIVAITLVFASLIQQHQGIFRRQMHYRALVSSEIFSLIGGLFAGVWAAVMGLGYWALVIKMIVEQLLLTITLWVLCPWRPGRPSLAPEVRAMLRFGGNLTGANLAGYIAANADKVCIGAFCGATPLGFYAKAHQLLYLPFQQIGFPLTRVIVSGLSRLQTDRDAYRQYFNQYFELLTFLSFPLVAFLLICADDVVVIVLGPKWKEAVGLFRLLGPAALLGSFGTAIRWVFISMGQTDRQFKWALITTAVSLAGYGTGVILWGAKGVAMSISVVRTCLVVPGLCYGLKYSPIRISDVFRTTAKPAATVLLASIFLLLWRGINSPPNAWSALGGALFVFAGVYVGAWLLFHKRARRRVKGFFMRKDPASGR